jgi:hypothetical protein
MTMTCALKSVLAAAVLGPALAVMAAAVAAAPSGAASTVSTSAALAPGMAVPGTEQVAIDFSYAGYGAGVPLPRVRAPILLVRPGGGDDTALLQAALDAAGRLPRQADGFRGIVELAPARFRVEGQLHMNADGVVLRGSSAGQTVLLAAGHGRRALIVAGGATQPVTAAAIAVVDQFVPAGALTLTVTLAGTAGLQPGDHVVVTRPSTKAWIRDLGMDGLPGTFAALRYHWPAGSRDLVWDRTISTIGATDAAGARITLDAPITTALEQRYGGATLAKVIADAPLRQIGIEQLAIDSEYEAANPRDEEHAWDGIVFDHVEDAWVREVGGRHLVSSLVRVGPRARRITVEHVRSEQPVGEPGGYRRLSFLVEGQQVLVQHCAADSGMNDFAIGFLAAGPNVFRACRATHAIGASGSYESWASGVLYEDVRVEGAALRLGFDPDRAQGGGWTAANAVVWNSRAAEIVAAGPAGAPNLIVRSAQPLFGAQLARRRGADIAARVLAGLAGPGSGKAIPGAGFSRLPFTLPAHAGTPVSAQPAAPSRPVAIRNGRFVIAGDAGDRAGRTLWGGAVNDAWWLGQTSPANALDAGASLTRFVPGRVGPGLTEDLAELAARVAAQGTPFYQSGPAIWYDRRRDDHTIAPRLDANVWAAFYELPWARSGKGRAQDGLSKYDLSRYNPWYFERIKTFARLCDERGIVLYHHLYNNHNVLETAAHWADYPWRPANNINDTGLPEPMPLESNQRIHVANQFYDVANPRLRALHEAYIVHVLDQLGANDNIIFGLAFQYSGPVQFQRFFQQTVSAWERRHGRHVKLVLDTSKNVTDAILADPDLARQVAVIDMRYWHYLPDGRLWAPQGGQNRAFRELHPTEFGDPSTPALVYRQVREYAAAYPDKAIVSWHSGVGQIPALMAGGAQVLTRNPTAGHGQGRDVDRTALDGFVQQHLAGDLADMLPRDGWVRQGKGERNWVLADERRRSVLVYSLAGPTIGFTRALAQGQRQYQALWFDPRTGRTSAAALAPQFGDAAMIIKPDEREWLLLLRAQ